MVVLLGALIVVIGVVGGYFLEGGHLEAIWQPVELLIIFGAAIGHVVISSPPFLMKSIVQQMLHAVFGKGPAREEYTQLLLLLYELIKTAKGNMLALEAHIEKPENSDIFTRYPSVLKNHHAIDFICDTLKVQISSPVPPFDLEELMDQDINTAHEEEVLAPNTMNRMAEAMPGLGIVAAVLGVVLTMGKLNMGRDIIGHSVGAALVGTLMGVLACYGFVQPLAAKMALSLAEESQVFRVIKAAILAFGKDCSPKVAIEFARRTVPMSVRPSFNEIDEATSAVRIKG